MPCISGVNYHPLLVPLTRPSLRHVLRTTNLPQINPACPAQPSRSRLTPAQVFPHTRSPVHAPVSLINSTPISYATISQYRP
ncbi:hypothetical protein FA95DRAFT_1563519 [Auriscalpium vulgare]|uniref:Uncharacterized protein n=1 Tax=Auriscalpium vulgare TaxID=40419 RepID=A0ACB8RH59_9AGAM|nr:hypothetical protein FA95DRAFT_1563519 [Auriscalpium vulgare]